MTNRINKPSLTPKQLVAKLSDDKGISFVYFDRLKAEEYLEKKNNYFRTASYRKNYKKHVRGRNTGKYLDRVSKGKEFFNITKKRTSHKRKKMINWT